MALQIADGGATVAPDGPLSPHSSARCKQQSFSQDLLEGRRIRRLSVLLLYLFDQPLSLGRAKAHAGECLPHTLEYRAQTGIQRCRWGLLDPRLFLAKLPALRNVLSAIGLLGPKLIVRAATNS